MIAFQHWRCEICKGYNDILNIYCILCKAYKPDWVTAKHQLHVQFDRGIFDEYGVLSRFHYRREGRAKNSNMTPNEELHAKFFSEEAVLVQGMSDVDLDEHIHSLEEIAREAKARIMASTEEKRNRKAKAGNKAWRIEPNGPDPTVSDSLNKVNQRSARMSKLEKMRDKLAELGIPDSEIEQMVSKMVSQARKEPAALRDEAKLKKTLAEPTIITEETRLAQIAERKRLDEKDKQEEKAEKAEKEKLTPFTVENENRLAVAVLDSESETAKAQAKSDLVKSKAQSLFGPNIA